MSRISKVKSLLEAMRVMAHEFTDEEISSIAAILLPVMSRLKIDEEKAPTDASQ